MENEHCLEELFLEINEYVQQEAARRKAIAEHNRQFAESHPLIAKVLSSLEKASREGLRPEDIITRGLMRCREEYE